MAYTTSVPVTRLVFSDGFKFYGDTTALSVLATVNLSVPEATDTDTGETLTDGALIPAQSVADFHVPTVARRGWRTTNGATLDGWSYDIVMTITATGNPTLLWTTTIAPQGNTVTLTPSAGTIAGGDSGGRPVVVTEDPNVPGAYLIGE